MISSIRLLLINFSRNKSEEPNDGICIIILYNLTIHGQGYFNLSVFIITYKFDSSVIPIIYKAIYYFENMILRFRPLMIHAYSGESTYGIGSTSEPRMCISFHLLNNDDPRIAKMLRT